MFDKIFPKYVNTKNIIFALVAILFITLVIKMPDIAIMFFACFVIACSLEPLVQKLENKIHRSKASAIVLGASILCLCAFFIPIIVIGSNEVRSLTENFPYHIESMKNFIISNPILNKTNLSNLDINDIISSATSVSGTLISGTINFGKNIGSAFVYLLISTLIIYYFMADKVSVKEATLKMFPPRMREKTSAIYDTISTKIGGYVIAQIATMASVGIVVTLGLLLLKVDYALLLGLITTLFDLVPVAGPAVAFVICMIAVYKYGPIVMTLTALIFGIAQLVENNIVRPYVFGKLLNIHPLLIYLFLFIAAKYLGILGVVFAPAIAATIVVLIEEIYMKSLESSKNK